MPSQTKPPARPEQETPLRPDAEEAKSPGLVGAELFQVAAPPAARDIREAILIKEGDFFLLSDLEGNIPPGNRDGLGLYFEDTRFLSGFELIVQGLHPTTLLSTGHRHTLSEQVLTNPTLVTAEGRTVHEQTLEIRRYRRLVATGVMESLAFQNFNPFPIRLGVTFRFEADFADMFEVRGLVARVARGRHLPPEYRDGRLLFRHESEDATVRETSVHLEPAATGVEGTTARYQLELEPCGSSRIAIRTSTRIERPHAAPSQARAGAPRPRNRDRPLQRVVVESSNGLFDAIFRRARLDLHTLVSQHEDHWYVAAGLPWYAALFGRDSLLTALMELWLSPELSAHVLRLLARYQADRDEAWRDEEPGKILHEVRQGELARQGLVPFAPYYGSVDATPLWIVLLAEYQRQTGDLDLVRELRPNLEAALAWIERYGDSDGDGFVEYCRRSASGLTNQGWKDSWDGIVGADGALAEPPIALVEVQGYVYAAKRGAAELFALLGEPGRALQLEREAEQLRQSFDAAFWMPGEGYYCLALDREKRQVASITSNPGHLLLTGILSEQRAGQVAARLFEEDMFSGWGIRTLSTFAAGYNPTGYHRGTVWPHDNALIALGLKRVGMEDSAQALITALFAAAEHLPSFALPELFCGFARSAFGTPVRYPVACSPQAWAAAACSALLQVMLGIRPNAQRREVFIVRPRLPQWLDWVRIGQLSIGGGSVDLRYRRFGEHTAVDVEEMRGDVRVTFLDRWNG